MAKIKHNMFGVLYTVSEPFRGKILLVLLCMLVDTCMTSLGIGMILPTFQVILTPGSHDNFVYKSLPWLLNYDLDTQLIILSATLVGLFSVRFLVGITKMVLIRYTAETFRIHWIKKIGQYYLYGPYSNIIAEKQGTLLNDWLNETLAAARFIQNYLTYLTSAFLAAGLLGLGFFMDWQAMLVFMVFGGVVILVLRNFMFGTAAKLGKKKLKLYQKITSIMNEAIHNAKDIKIFNVEAAQLQKIHDVALHLRSVFVRITFYVNLPPLLSEFIAIAVVMFFLIFEIVILDKNPNTVLPVVAFFLAVFYRMFGALSQAVSSRIKALNEYASVERVNGLASSFPDSVDERESCTPLDINDDIIFKDISFSYTDNVAVLKSFSATLPSGNIVFIVGDSGSGKSTLMDILLQLTTPDSGSITYKDRDVSEYDINSWRCSFGYVSQEANLFNGTIRDNILLTCPSANQKDIEQACRIAGVNDFLGDMNAGLDIFVGERGLALSGGQRKRIGIARALVRHPSVLILDEATTSFENELEANIIKDIVAHYPGITIVVITHRLQTASIADVVIYLKYGKLVASESYREMLQKHPELFTSEAPD